MTATFRDALDTMAKPVGPRHVHPNGFTPGLHDRGDAIELIGSQDSKPQPEEWRELLTNEGYDPDEFRLDERGLEIRKWQQRAGDDFLYYYKFKIVRSIANEVLDHLSTKLEAVKKRRPLTARTGLGEHAAFVVNLADWQAGASHGGGPDELANRIAEIGPAVLRRVSDLRKIGFKIDKLIVHSLGDMGEGCSAFSPMSIYQLELTDEEQRQFLLESYDSLIDQWVGQFDQITIYAVPGNHGEKRRTGEKTGFTDYRDNTDTGVWANLAWMHDKNPERYGHVSTHLPTGQDLHLTYEHDGFITCLIHGHQARGGTTPVAAIQKWWKSQMDGMTSAGDANMIVAGHHHHLRVAQPGPRTVVVAPALCGRQDWWMNHAGLDSPALTLTYLLTGDGWSQMEMI